MVTLGAISRSISAHQAANLLTLSLQELNRPTNATINNNVFTTTTPTVVMCAGVWPAPGRTNK